MIRGLLPCVRGGVIGERGLRSLVGRRGIAVSNPVCARKMPDRPKAPSEKDFIESFLKGSGPGGQKINKTSSAVQLKHIPTGLVLKVQHTRSRTQNRKIARQMLADKLEELEKGQESRVAVVGETKRKRKSSAVKKSKRKYRLLDEAKGAGIEGESEAIQNVEDDAGPETEKNP